MISEALFINNDKIFIFSKNVLQISYSSYKKYIWKYYILKVVCASLPRHRSRYPHVMYRVTWRVGTVISLTFLAGFVFKVPWMDIEWQSKLQKVTLILWMWVFIVLRCWIFSYHPPALKSAGVRKASVLALQNLYEVDDSVPSLNLFTDRFYKRMLELADDIDISVAVCAIGLVKQLLR